jgi:hypothetical protein
MNKVLDKRFRNIDAEAGIVNAVRREFKKQWQTAETYMIKYKDRWERRVRKHKLKCK